MGGVASRRTALAAGLAALLLAPACARGDDLPYGITKPAPASVRMSDGTTLAVDVYYPTDQRTGRPAAGRFPTILSMTPYGKRSTVTTQATGSSAYGGDGFYPWLVRHGYVDVVADVRGTGSSNGVFELFGPREMRDGAELVRWASRLAHSTGRVGMAGSSYVGLNQIFTAALSGRRSPLRAIVPEAAGIDLYRDLAFGGGIPNVEFAGVWDGLRATMTAAAPDDPGSDPSALVRHPGERAQRLAQLDAAMDAEIDTGGPRAFDGAWWQQRAPHNYLARVVRNGIPAMLVSGWNDVYQRGVVLDYAALQNLYARAHPRRGRPAPPVFGPMARGEVPTGRYPAVIGPAYHNAVVLGQPLQGLLLRWFDTWLKGAHTGMGATHTPLHAYELGAGRWVNAGRYPFPQAKVRRLWLGAGPTGSASSLNDGALTERRPSGQGSDRVAWTDATSPCSNQADQWNTGFVGYFTALAGMPNSPCAKDDRTTQANALTYTTEPLAGDVSIAGPIDATVFASSTTQDAELAVTLEDVAPDGSSRPLTTGALLASHRALDRRLSWTGAGGRTILPYHPYTRAASRPLRPGATERLEVEVYPTLARIVRGHRLRVTIATAATHLHPSPVQLTRLAGGVYQVARGGANGSFVDVPIADPAAFATSRVPWQVCGGGC